MTRPRLRPCWLAIGWALVTTVVAPSLVPEPPAVPVPEGDKAAHVAAYGVLMWWFLQLYPRRRWIVIALALVALGVALEMLQGLSTIRSFESADILADTAGVALGWLVGRTRGGRALLALERRLGLSAGDASARPGVD